MSVKLVVLAGFRFSDKFEVLRAGKVWLVTIARSRIEFEVKLEQIWEQIIGCDIFPILDISTTFRRVTSQDISRIIEKYKHDFEICGYDDTLHELKMLTRKKLLNAKISAEDLHPI